MNKKYLLTTSAMITLSLLNVSNIQAEEKNTEDITAENILHNSEETSKEALENKTSQEESNAENQNDDDLIFHKKIKSFDITLDTEEKEFLNEFILSNSEFLTQLKEAVNYHESGDFESAVQLYQEITEENINEQSQDTIHLSNVIEKLISLAERNIDDSKEVSIEINDSSSEQKDTQSGDLNDTQNRKPTTFSLNVNRQNSSSDLADELYLEVMNAKSAAKSWEDAQSFKKNFEGNDPRVEEAINQAAHNILKQGIKRYENERFKDAINYFDKIINEKLVSNNLSSQASSYRLEALKQLSIEESQAMYNEVLTSQFASESWKKALTYKEAFGEIESEQEKVREAINHAASNILNMGIRRHQDNLYSDAIGYYNRILGEELVDSKINSLAEFHKSQALNNTYRTEDDLYRDIMNARYASQAWDDAQIYKKYFVDTDPRVHEAMNQAAEYILNMGIRRQEKQLYTDAITYYDNILNEELVSQNLKNAAEFYKSQAESLNYISADDLYEGIMNAKYASQAWDDAQTFKKYFNGLDSRVEEAVNQAATYIINMGIRRHKNNLLEDAVNYYEQVLSDNLVEASTRNTVEFYLVQAEQGNNFTTATDLYNKVTNAQFASESWEDAQTFKEHFLGFDERVNEAINQAGQNIFSMGTKHHSNGMFDDAINYYNQILSEELINESIKNKATSYLKQAKDQQPLITANELYNRVMNGKYATETWEDAQLFKKYYQSTDNRVVEVINKAAHNILNMGIRRHNNKKYSDAVEYYDKIIAEPLVNNSAWTIAESYRYLAMHNYDLSNLIIRETNYEISLSDVVSIQMNYSPQIWDTSVENGPWRNATRKEVEKFVNPANVKGNQDFLQFLRLSGSSGISTNDLNRVLGNAGILTNKGHVFKQAAQEANVNELYLISHALLETGRGTSRLANGILVDEVNGKKVEPRVVYNMFGIGAVDSAPNKLGSERAYVLGWFTPEAAIIGGAQWISASYINHPIYQQDTLYKMRWNPASPGVHQYATDVSWAYSQTNILNDFLLLSQQNNAIINFDVPKYK